MRKMTDADGVYPMNEIPLIDWNGNGKIDSQDIALSLAIAESEREESNADDE